MPRGQRRARGLEQVAIRYAGGTRGLACATAKTTVEMTAHVFVVGEQRALEERAHEQQPSARTVVLVLERHVRRTALKAESAMHTCVQPSPSVRERSIRKRAMFRCAMQRGGISGGRHDCAPRMPALRIRAGSNLSLIARETGSFEARESARGHALWGSRSVTTVP